MQKYFNNPYLSDYTFICGEEKFPAHKIILDTCCYFNLLLTTKVGSPKDFSTLEKKVLYTYCVGHLYGVKYKDVEMSLEDFMLVVETAHLWEIYPSWLKEFALEHFDDLLRADWKFMYTYFQREFDMEPFLEENIDIFEEDIIDHEVFEVFTIKTQMKILAKFNRKNEILKFLENCYDSTVKEFLDTYIKDNCILTNFQKSHWLRCDGDVHITASDSKTCFLVVKSLEPFQADYYEYFDTKNSVCGTNDEKIYKFTIIEDIFVKKTDKFVFMGEPVVIANIEEILSDDQPLFSNIEYEIRLDIDLTTIKNGTSIYRMFKL